MLFSGMIDSIIGYIGETDLSIRRDGSQPFLRTNGPIHYFLLR